MSRSVVRISFFPSPAERLVDADPVQPCEQRRVAAVPVEVAPCLHEGVLDGLLDVPSVVEDTEEDEPEPPLVSPYDLRERLQLPFLGGANERLVTVQVVCHRPIVCLEASV